MPQQHPSPLLKPFTDHPAEVGETYAQHFMVASGFSLRLLRAAAAAALHAAVPAWCACTASEEIERMHQEMASRHTKQ